MPLTLLLWGSLLTFLFVVGSFIYLIVKYSALTDWSLLAQLDYRYIFASFILFFLYHSFDMLRLKAIAEGFNIDYPYTYAYITSFIATFGATVTPAHIGGELIIFYMLRRLKAKTHKIWGTILFKTVSGFAFFLIAFPLFVWYIVSDIKVLKKILTLILIFGLFSTISLPLIKWFQKIGGKHPLKKSLKLYCLSLIYFWRHKKKEFLKACFYSVMLYLTFLSFAPILLKAFHIQFNWLEIYLVQLPLIYAIFSSPTPGGSGVGELGGVAIFQGLIPASALGLFIILWRFFSQYLGATIGGLLFTYVLYKDIKNYKKS